MTFKGRLSEASEEVPASPSIPESHLWGTTSRDLRKARGNYFRKRTQLSAIPLGHWVPISLGGVPQEVVQLQKGIFSPPTSPLPKPPALGPAHTPLSPPITA